MLDPLNGEVLIKAGEPINEDVVDVIEKAGVDFLEEVQAQVAG